MLPLPSAPTDSIRLADWLELHALASPDRNVSRGDLERVLIQASIFDAQGLQALEQKLLEVFAELEQRATAAGPAYPFSVEGPVLQARRSWLARSSYVFCLCLSYFGWAHVAGEDVYPRRMFEALCRHAAGEYLHGSAVRFGSPRTPPEMPRSFREAVDALCQAHVREGDGFRGQSYGWRKDYGLDVVAWRDCRDRLPGKLLLFGACASGADWEDKIYELRPDEFCQQWMVQVPVSPFIKAFFVPHRIEARRWETTSRLAGIVFDRCRISGLSPRLPNMGDFGDGLAWARSMVLRARAAA